MSPAFAEVGLPAYLDAKAGDLYIAPTMAIAGYDNLELARFTNPPLTTVAQPKKEVGIQALNLLVNRISGKNLLHSRLVLAPELIIRRSTQQAI